MIERTLLRSVARNATWLQFMNWKLWVIPKIFNLFVIFGGSIEKNLNIIVWSSRLLALPVPGICAESLFFRTSIPKCLLSAVSADQHNSYVCAECSNNSILQSYLIACADTSHIISHFWRVSNCALFAVEKAKSLLEAFTKIFVSLLIGVLFLTSDGNNFLPIVTVSTERLSALQWV